MKRSDLYLPEFNSENSETFTTRVSVFVKACELNDLLVSPMTDVAFFHLDFINSMIEKNSCHVPSKYDLHGSTKCCFTD